MILAAGLAGERPLPVPLTGFEVSLIHVTVRVAVDAVSAPQVIQEEPLVAIPSAVLQQPVAALAVVFELTIVGGAVLELVAAPAMHQVAQVEALVYVSGVMAIFPIAVT